jgi:hypothetical protein
MRDNFYDEPVDRLQNLRLIREVHSFEQLKLLLKWEYRTDPVVNQCCTWCWCRRSRSTRFVTS